jgi:cob(I)alamin adenosyltransferase
MWPAVQVTGTNDKGRFAKMKIYTKTGDSGETGLFAGPRVRKDDPRIEAYGTVDELNAVLGLARCQNLPQEIDSLTARIQHTLFDLGAELATPDPASRGTDLISTAHIEALEAEIDKYDTGLPPLKTFILPGGVSGAALLHLARTVCRRAERHVVTLGQREKEGLSPHVLTYLNRLSDLLFVLARAVNHAAGHGDIQWQKSTDRADARRHATPGQSGT